MDRYEHKHASQSEEEDEINSFFIARPDVSSSFEEVQ